MTTKTVRLRFTLGIGYCTFERDFTEEEAREIEQRFDAGETDDGLVDIRGAFKELANSADIDFEDVQRVRRVTPEPPC